VRRRMLLGLVGIGLCLAAAVLLAVFRPFDPPWLAQLRLGMPTKEFLAIAGMDIKIGDRQTPRVRFYKDGIVVNADLSRDEVRTVEIVQADFLKRLRRIFLP
jgi:hypothetical protein